MATNAGLEKSEFWKRKFHQQTLMMDVDRSGTLSRSDFEAMVEGFRKNYGNSDKVKKMSLQLLRHCKKIGFIDDSVEMTYENYKQRWLAVTEREEYRSILQAMFEIIDINGDGTISFEEWKKYTEAVRIPSDRARATFDAIDKDGDETITKKEFIDYQLEFFFSTEDKLKSGNLYGLI